MNHSCVLTFVWIFSRRVHRQKIKEFEHKASRQKSYPSSHSLLPPSASLALSVSYHVILSGCHLRRCWNECNASVSVWLAARNTFPCRRPTSVAHHVSQRPTAGTTKVSCAIRMWQSTRDMGVSISSLSHARRNKHWFTQRSIAIIPGRHTRTNCRRGLDASAFCIDAVHQPWSVSTSSRSSKRRFIRLWQQRHVTPASFSVSMLVPWYWD